MDTVIVSSKNPIFRFAVRELKEKAPKGFDFALFAVSPNYPYQDVPATIKKEFGSINYVGFSSSSAFENIKLVNDGIVGCFFKFNSPKTKVCTFVKEKINEKNRTKVLKELIAFLKERKGKLNVVIGDFIEGEFPILIEKVGEELQKLGIDSPLVGGVTATPTQGDKREKSYLFYNGNTVENGFIVVSFSNVDFQVQVSSGVFKKGPVYTVTKCDSFKIYELNGKKAGYLPKKLLKDIEPAEDNRFLLWYTPFGIVGEKDEIEALRVIRSFSDEYVELWGPVKEGDRLKLSVVLSTELLKDAEENARELKASFGMADFCFNFSCLARAKILEQFEEKEIELYGRLLNAPLFGFFTHGEVATKNGKLRLHNLTSVIVAVRERYEL